MKILVLGHMGMLGTDIVSKLSGSHDVIGKDIDDFDITDQQDCHRLIIESDAEIVINAAAYTNVDDCEDNREICFAVNANGVKNVAQSCTEQEIKLVHFSTDYVFDGTQNTPYPEDFPYNPINVYGQSKLQGEQYLREYSNNYILIRTAWLYGKNGKNFVDTIIEKAQIERSLQVVDDQIGSPTYTVDLASAVKVLIEGNHTGIFHVTNRGTCSWYDFALKILQYTDVKNVEVKPVPTETFPRKALRPHYSVLSCKKFYNATQRTMRFWQIALKDYLNRRSSQVV
jgi:dTDP-4-dehydrorhamnose reductase